MPSDPYVPLIVIGLVVIIVFLAGRPKAQAASEPPEEPPSGAELIEHLQRTLGIVILVEAVESVEATGSSGSADTVAIRATLMSGNHTTSVAVAGPTESDAWAALARGAIAWRNSDYQHIRIWGSGG